MKILLLGASGSVGSALIPRLREENLSIVGFTRSLENAARLAQSTIEVVVGDVQDPNAIAKAAQGVDVIVHAVGVPPDAPRDVLKWVNVAGTENVLRAARHADVKRVVTISCADVTLSWEHRIHWNENRRITHAPLSAHAQTKALAEEMALVQSDVGLEVLALRPAFLWGNAGPKKFLSAQEIEKGIRLWGSGKTLFATTHVTNLAHAIVQAIRAPSDAYGRAYYITDNEALHAHEFFSELSRALKLPPPRTSFPSWIARSIAKSKRLSALLHTPLRDVVLRTQSSLFDCGLAVKHLNYQPQLTVEQAFQALTAQHTQ